MSSSLLFDASPFSCNVLYRLILVISSISPPIPLLSQFLVKLQLLSCAVSMPMPPDAGAVQKADQIAHRFFTKFALLVDNARNLSPADHFDRDGSGTIKTDKWVSCNCSYLLYYSSRYSLLYIMSSLTLRHLIRRRTRNTFVLTALCLQH